MRLLTTFALNVFDGREVEVLVMRLTAGARATAIGSLPHQDPEDACDLILRHFKEIPFWPQLPQRSPLENMNIQFAQGLPGFIYDAQGEKGFIDHQSPAFFEELEVFYQDYIDDRLDALALDPDYAAGFPVFLRRLRSLEPKPLVVKGHVTGPITLGMGLLDRAGRPSLYHESMSDVITKSVSLRARWQVKQYRSILPNTATLIFFDEPYLTSFGSAHVGLERGEVISRLEQVFSSVEGMRGVHCCGRTDWTLFTETSVDVISFDAYDYPESLALYPDKIRDFLARGGWLAWGIVPSSLPSPDKISTETKDSLVSKFEDGLTLLAETGISREELLEASLITPSCGTGGMRADLAERTLRLTADVSESIRDKYFTGRH